jgi:YesN/AraC family two-component response regulator
VRSIPDVLTKFEITFPHQEVTFMENTERKTENDEIILLPVINNTKPVIKKTDYKFIKSRPTILIIDDDTEMLWFISDIFTEHYNIIPAENPAMVSEILEQNQPNLIISDIMIPQIDGITLMKQIKKDKRMTHIPYILLSAKNTPEEQIEGINAGAEIYLTKPFNVEYLKSIVDRLLQRQDDLKDYYHSTISSFELTEGKYIHKDEKTFLEKTIRIIDQNITNPEFSTEQLASHLGLSARHLSRKLKKFIDQTPPDLIRNYRLDVVEKLLITTQISIDEIMYKAGFSNRGSFYHAFSKKFGMTPKNYRIKEKK